MKKVFRFRKLSHNSGLVLKIQNKYKQKTTKTCQAVKRLSMALKTRRIRCLKKIT